MNKSWEGRIYFNSQLHVSAHHCGNSGRNLEAETAEAMEGHCPLVPSQGLLSLFSYSTKACLPRDAAAHAELGPSTSTPNQENAPHTCLHANLMEAFFSIKIPSSHIRL